MDIGIGLPSTIPGVTREQHLEWARRAEAAGFSTLGVIDRVAYENLEPLVALTAAAAVTERIRLTTSIAIVPYRNTAMFAKEAASVDVLSGGRLTLGLAPGGREDDYTTTGTDFSTRGRRLDAQLEELKRLWNGDDVGPKPVQQGGPPLILGGTVDAAFRRAAQFGEGWIAGGSAPDAVRAGAEATRQAWEAAGRAGKPRIMALGYYSLGSDAQANAEAYLKHYYAFLGDELAGMIAGSAAKDAPTIQQYLSAFQDAGVDEFILFPCSPDPEQVDLLAKAAL
jgi:alkanesulfonate monooxygenase SsuD/methylene tetrahydromethanopterin reductase-like flavin-dependent oxidoreductase (luciferase family)